MSQQGSQLTAASAIDSDSLIAGVDEVGRGPLAGPVVAAAVILNPALPLEGLADSKLLTARQREHMAPQIQRRALAWSIAWADAAEVDTLNILQATFLAMRRAVLGLCVHPHQVLVDGNRAPLFESHNGPVRANAIIGGDATIPCISAASIIAKVERDQMMLRFDRLYPQYGFARHKGYGTAVHRDMLQRHGPCQQHRYSFRPLSTMNTQHSIQDAPVTHD
jgi:ribonuclease HII